MTGDPTVQLIEGTTTVTDLDEFLGNLDDIAAETDCTVQAFDARYVADREHLQRAVTLADRAFERGENVARDRGVEILLYAAARRQIDRALEMGVSEGEASVVVLIAAEADTVSRADREHRAAERVHTLLDDPGTAVSEDVTLRDTDDTRLREFFDVTDRELAATPGTLSDLIHERVALLDVKK